MLGYGGDVSGRRRGERGGGGLEGQVVGVGLEGLGEGGGG